MSDIVKKCLACYKAQENTAALWLVGNFYVYGNFRAHGHGEFDLLARDVYQDKWQEVISGLNADFGRLCDRQVQKIITGGRHHTLLEEIAECWGTKIADEDQALDFQNLLAQALFEPLFSGVEIEPTGMIKQMVEQMIIEGGDAEEARQWGKSSATAMAVMEGPDFFRILDGGKRMIHGKAIAYLIASFTRESLCYESDEAMVALAKACK